MLLRSKSNGAINNAKKENSMNSTSSILNKGKRAKRDDSLPQSSAKKRAAALQDITNFSQQSRQGQSKVNSNSRVTRSMTVSERKSQKQYSCETVVQKKEIHTTNGACSASTTRNISRSFAEQATINEAEPRQIVHRQRNQDSGRTAQDVQNWKDIDFADRHDVRMCTEYVNDVYTNAQLKQAKHRPNPNYMEVNQRDITVTMRGILIDWLVEVAQEYNQSPETLFLSVGYIDGYLSKARCVRSKLQLVGITCMHIASKYQEIYPPAINEFCYITDNTYEREELVVMERKLLDALDFKLSIPTTWMFLSRYVRVAEVDKITEYLGFYLAELSLLEYTLLQYLPSQIAAASVMLALYNRNKPHWSATLEYYTGYTPRALRECATILHRVHFNAKVSTLPAIREKYSVHHLGGVAQIDVKELRPSLFDEPY